MKTNPKSIRSIKENKERKEEESYNELNITKRLLEKYSPRLKLVSIQDHNRVSNHKTAS